MVSAVEADHRHVSADSSRRAPWRVACRGHLRWHRTLIVLLGLGYSAMAAVAEAHPMGNFSISHYSRLTVEPQGIEVRYLVDMAEIPTFQEIQDSAIVAEAGHPTLDGYLTRKTEDLRAGLLLDLNDQRLTLRSMSRTILFSPGAGEPSPFDAWVSGSS